ncbi:esterase-like activity of phytase family protein [Bradyrhizobium prioriisuperbiae]|uniref:esterase-like activity of phytase family protein n=1 Tax=Bradyrhizobium prioriisuperbiae TaxID=2854389 RepID=UPI0028EAF27D|nr:esterase-like activity of phytase family protein [Bradyrhizobium prioritasuperba]
MPHRSGRRLHYSVVGLVLLAISVIPAALMPVFLVQAQVSSPSPPPTAPGPVAIEVGARPIAYFDQRDSSRVRFGSLEFVSGVALTSSFRGFGGLSGLRLDAKGERFTALSDKGDWFTGRLVYRGKQLTGLADVQTAPILGPDGLPVGKRGWFDTESLAVDGDTAYVGIERVNQILRFETFGRDGVRAHGEPITAPPALRRLPFNKGLESLVTVPRNLPLGGTLIAISERGLDPGGNTLAFLLGGPSPGQFTIRRTNDFDISDAAILPSGALLILERKFSVVAGVGIRIRRIPLSSIVPDRLVDGAVIFEADLANEVDNMEGLDVHETPEGDTILTMVSDDNFSLIQRTLLLQFKLVEP